MIGILGFVGRRTKGRKQATSVLRNNAGVSITSTKGKLRILQSHYHDLGSSSAFDEGWKQEAESRVGDCSSMSNSLEDGV